MKRTYETIVCYEESAKRSQFIYVLVTFEVKKTFYGFCHIYLTGLKGRIVFAVE